MWRGGGGLMQLWCCDAKISLYLLWDEAASPKTPLELLWTPTNSIRGGVSAIVEGKELMHLSQKSSNVRRNKRLRFLSLWCQSQNVVSALIDWQLQTSCLTKVWNHKEHQNRTLHKPNENKFRSSLTLSVVCGLNSAPTPPTHTPPLPWKSFFPGWEKKEKEKKGENWKKKPNEKHDIMNRKSMFPCVCEFTETTALWFQCPALLQLKEAMKCILGEK